ncbi:hypothetical protein EV378_1063 [Pseudonocardia endophytica]|uniref:Uncharacterized protein n=1 Tax=Pseudonocardia endophytica TaxID=401976 RepID=A0A4R1HWV1_PSEEN|nr:hypothetical protein EV378_1063 [Pseudonocardia endophytica]
MLVAGLVASSAMAVPSVMAAPSAMAATGVTCAVPDQRLTELSGLVADGARWWAIADGGRVSRAISLDPGGCATTGERSAPIDPVDVEDVGIGPDGALWLADIGDNTGERDTVAAIVLPSAGPARLHRFAYPDGPHDAEALVVADDGVPLIVTKTVGAAGIYRPDGAPGAGTTPLRRVGQIVLPESTTPGGPLGSAGSRTITGAGLSPAGAAGPGRVVAVRTYTDAWLFRLPSGATASGLVEALAGPPVQVALPDEAQGEAVALTADGTLVSGGEARGGRPATIRTVPGAVGEAVAPDAPVAAQPDAPPGPSTPAALPAIIGAGTVAVLLCGLAVAMTLHARRRR